MVEALTCALVTITAIAWGRLGGPVCTAWMRDLVREMDPGRADAEVVTFARVLEGRAT